MTLYDKLERLKPDVCGMEPRSRIWTELRYAADVSAADGHAYDECVGEAADCALAALQSEGALTLSAVKQAEDLLAPIAAAAKSYTAHCVGHAHIDMNWMWGYNETAAVTVETFRTVLDLMKEYPNFTFGQSQASTYRIIEECAPEMLDEIRQRVHEGRWEVTASTWVENDKNMASGEALCRHILYTKQYLSKLLDIDPASLKLDFQPDTFGHSVNVPEACAAGGVKYYYHCRGREDSPAAYVWRSRAGHELLVYNEPHWYNTDITPQIFVDYPQLCKGYSSRDFLLVYGVGDHGGGPTRRDLDRLIEMSSWPIMPSILFSTYARFFEALEKSRASLPVYTGEFNYTFTGCYTSQSRIKMANHIGEDRIYESEFLNAAAHALTAAPDRQEMLDEAWRDILFNQFHDILPGSGTIETREYAMGRFQSAMAKIQTAAAASMRAIAEAIDSSALDSEPEADNGAEGAGVGRAVGQDFHFAQPSTGRSAGKKRIFHLFNSTSVPFDGVTSLTVWDWNHDADRALFRDGSGEPTVGQFVEEGKRYWGHTFKTFLIWARVPAFGYATYTLEEASVREIRVAPPTDRVDRFGDDDVVLENDLIRFVFVRRDMSITHAWDKAAERELPVMLWSAFNFVEENAMHGMTAWRVGEEASWCNVAGGGLIVRDKESGPLRQSVRFECEYGRRSKLDVTVSLDAGSRMLEYSVHTDFQEVGTRSVTPQLRFEAGFLADDAEITGRYDVPFGTIDRPQQAHDVPALSFAAAVPRDTALPALVLLSDSKYGFRLQDDDLELTLIRGSSDPDPYPEYGLHDFRIGLCVAPEYDPDTLLDLSRRFRHPIAVCSARASGGSLPLSGSLLSVSGARVEAVKQAADGKGIVLRLCEESGKGGGYAVSSPCGILSACEADSCENPLETLECAGGEARGSIAANELKTVLIELGKFAAPAGEPLSVVLPQAEKIARR